MYSNKPGGGRVAFGVLGGIMSIIVGAVFILAFLSADSFEDTGIVLSILYSILGAFLLVAAVNDIISLFSQKYKAFSENIARTHSALPVIEIVMLSICCLFMLLAMIFIFDEEFLYEFGEEGALIVAIILVLTIIDTIMIIVSKGKLLQNRNTYNPYYPQQGGYNNPNQPMYGYGNNYQQSNGIQTPYGNNYQQSNAVQNPYGNNYQQLNGVQNPYGNSYQQQDVSDNSYGESVTKVSLDKNTYDSFKNQDNENGY